MASASALTVAKFFSSGMVLQEAPSTANIYGTFEEGQVTVIVRCMEEEDEEVIAEQVTQVLYNGTLLENVIILDREPEVDCNTNSKIFWFEVSTPNQRWCE